MPGRGIAAAVTACVVLCWACVGAGHAAGPTRSTKPGTHAVIACYFHRTVRCPTCRTVSAYIEEAIRTGFAEEVRSGQVRLAMIDFEDPKNRAYVAAYHITSPTLVLLDVHDGRVTRWMAAPKVWSLVGRKSEFVRYVQSGIRNLLTDHQGFPPMGQPE